LENSSLSRGKNIFASVDSFCGGLSLVSLDRISEIHLHYSIFGRQIIFFGRPAPEKQFGENMKKYIFIAILTLLLNASAAFGQTLAGGNPPLTQATINKLVIVYEHLFEIKLSQTERERLKQGVILYWTENNRAGIQESLSNAAYADKPDEVEELRNTSQAAFIEAYRRDIAVSNDPVYIVLVEAFDKAHADKREATRAKSFNDLIGTWRKSDALLARRDSYSGAAVGVSFTDSATLEIFASGAFHLVKAHNNCSSGCCRMDGAEEFGKISIVAGAFVYWLEKGSSLIDDACLGKKQRTVAKPHKETFKWIVRPNPNNGAATLCLTNDAKEVQCYEKQ